MRFEAKTDTEFFLYLNNNGELKYTWMSVYKDMPTFVCIWKQYLRDDLPLGDKSSSADCV